MAYMYDKNRNLVEVPDEKVFDAYSSGQFGFDSSKKINLYDPETKKRYAIPGDRAIDGYRAGLKTLTPEIAQEFHYSEKYGDGVGNSLLAAFTGAVGGFTFGLGTAGIAAMSPEAKVKMRELKKRHGVSSAVGEIGGFAAGAVTGGPAAWTVGAEKVVAGALVKKLGEGTAKKILANAIGASASGAMIGAGSGVADSALNDYDKFGERMAAHVGIGALTGLLVPPALHYSGAAVKKTASFAARKLSPKAISEGADLSARDWAIKILGLSKSNMAKIETKKGLDESISWFRAKKYIESSSNERELVISLENDMSDAVKNISSSYSALDQYGIENNIQKVGAKKLIARLESEVIGSAPKREEARKALAPVLRQINEYRKSLSAAKKEAKELLISSAKKERIAAARDTSVFGPGLAAKQESKVILKEMEEKIAKAVDDADVEYTLGELWDKRRALDDIMYHKDTTQLSFVYFSKYRDVLDSELKAHVRRISSEMPGGLEIAEQLAKSSRDFSLGNDLYKAAQTTYFGDIRSPLLKVSDARPGFFIAGGAAIKEGAGTGESLAFGFGGSLAAGIGGRIVRKTAPRMMYSIMNNLSKPGFANVMDAVSENTVASVAAGAVKSAFSGAKAVAAVSPTSVVFRFFEPSIKDKSEREKIAVKKAGEYFRRLSLNVTPINGFSEMAFGDFHKKAPDAVTSAESSAIRAVNYLAANAPGDSRGVVSIDSSIEYEPTRGEVRDFKRRIEAVDNPYVLLNQVAELNVSAVSVEAVATVYPRLYSEIVMTVAEKIQDMGKRMPRALRDAFSILSGTTVRDSGDAVLLARIQNLWQKDMRLDTGMSSVARGVSTINTSGAYQTRTDRAIT